MTSECLIKKRENNEKELIAYDIRDAKTPDHWIRRHRDLVRLTGSHPFNSEPPLTKLMNCGPITSNGLHYVRNHGYVPERKWGQHTLTIEGMGLTKPIVFTMDDLLNMPSRTIPVLLVCAGNRRKEQNMVKQSIGFSWGPSACSTAYWTGVSLWHLLEEKCGISLSQDVVHVCFEGSEDLPKGKYGTSVPLSKALDRASDFLLAYKMNGEFLPPDHGYPLRLVLPGYIGGRMVKWLSSIKITPVESQNYFHFHDNRVLPPPVTSAEVANLGKWWYKPEYIINELNVNSAISHPAHDQSINVSDNYCCFKGYAYAGGGRKVIRVELSMNDGSSWTMCEIHREIPSTKYGKHWCWVFWTLNVSTFEIASAASAGQNIAVRAWDESMNTQPSMLTWNLMGMMNNCYFRLLPRIISNSPNGNVNVIKFSHPTQPGPQEGGWMEEKMHATLSHWKPVTISSDTDSSSTDENTSSDEDTSDANIITRCEVARHCTAESCWIIIKKNVYDCTNFLKSHPGGKASIMMHAGQDCTAEFDAIHSSRAWKLLKQYRIGSTVQDSASSPENIFKNLKMTLVSRTKVSRTAEKFVFTTEDAMTDYLPGHHVLFKSEHGVKRAYTPVSVTDDKKRFEFIIRLYPKGVMSQVLSQMEEGHVMNVQAPMGHIVLLPDSKGILKIGNKKLDRVSSVGMIAAGTGVTPFVSILPALLLSDVNVRFVICHRSVDEMLCVEELEELRKEYSNRLSLMYFVSSKEDDSTCEFVENQPPPRSCFTYGRLTADGIEEYIGAENCVVLTCGPQGFIDNLCIPSFKKMNVESFAQF